MQNDLIIKNGNIIDGTGSDAYSGDIAIKDGLITEIGEVNGEAAEIIDAEGMTCLLYTSPSPRDKHRSRMPSSA